MPYSISAHSTESVDERFVRSKVIGQWVTCGLDISSMSLSTPDSSEVIFVSERHGELSQNICYVVLSLRGSEQNSSRILLN